MYQEFYLNDESIDKLLKIYNMYKTEITSIDDIIIFCINYTYQNLKK